MKIAVMTWYKYLNFGSVLQAYATNWFLRNNGHDVYMIDYKPKGNNKEVLSIKFIINKAKNKIKYRNINLENRNNVFDEFVSKNLAQTNNCSSFAELYDLNDLYDKFVCGSDQIWSPLCFDSHYFLDFADTDKIIAYAPSMGPNRINDDIIKSKIATLVSRFDFLSVREEQGKNLIKNICNKDSRIVLDPTLLLSKDDWIKAFDLKTNDSKNYILCYFLGESNKYFNQITKFAKENNFEIINIPFLRYTKLNKYNLDHEVGPEEFVNLIYNATYVFTDSFHGTIFSINFNKNFYTYRRFKEIDPKNQNSRIKNILKIFELEERIVDKNSKIFNNDIEYSKINYKLNELRNDSQNFLINAINNRTTNDDKSQDKSICAVKQCCGCGSCASVCPVNAISIKINNDGFQHYIIDRTKCINCGMCQNACPMMRIHSKELLESKKLYSFKSNDINVLAKSSSGGFSHILANMLNKEYYVVGCTYDNNSDLATHTIIKPNSFNELSLIQGSKYIQSITVDSFSNLLKLPENSKVLFFGTPCQIAALDKILRLKGKRKDYILVDLICHGVPSILVWKKYLNYIFKKHPSLKFNHRIIIRNGILTKKRKYLMTMMNDKNEIVYKNDQSKDVFYTFFNDGACYNESCFECPYRQKSSADIRIGDYWGNKFKSDNTGVSMILINTDKGEEIFEKIKDLDIAEITEQPLQDYWSVQVPYNPRIPIYRDKIMEDIKDKDIHIKTIKNKYYKYNKIICKMRALKRSLIKK